MHQCIVLELIILWRLDEKQPMCLKVLTVATEKTNGYRVLGACQNSQWLKARSPVKISYPDTYPLSRFPLHPLACPVCTPCLKSLDPPLGMVKGETLKYVDNL